MLTVVIMLMAIVTAAQAEVRAGSVSVTPFAGSIFFEGNQDLKTSAVCGLRAGYNFTKHLGVEGFFSYTQTEIQDESQWRPWQDVYNYGIEGLYHFMPEGRFVPFIAIGIGGIHYGYPEEYRRNKFAVDYGAGLKIFITDDIALRADVRHVIPFNDRYNDLLVTFGICFSFGGEQKEVSAARVEEPVVAPAPAVAAAPVVTESLAPVSNEQKETKSIPEEDVKNLVNKWLASWQSGDMEIYRGCYASDFQSKGMNLNAWISYKNNVRQKSKNISIRIEDLKISADAKTATATAIFNQYYSSSLLKDTVKKTLKLKKVNEDWKIYRETIVPIK